MLKITCCPLQRWQLNNSTRGPSEKINTHQIAKMWMQFVGKVDLMWVCAGCQHRVSSQGGLKHVAALIPTVRVVLSWPCRACFPRASNKWACKLKLALDYKTSSALKGGGGADVASVPRDCEHQVSWLMGRHHPAWRLES